MEQKEYERLQKIREDCKVCNGVGYHVIEQKDGSLQLDDCECVKHLQHEIKLIEANIPRPYRNWTFRKLTNDFLKQNKKAFGIINTYIDNIDKNISNGIGLWLHSIPGLAKSSIICNILKKTLEKSYTPYYERASHLLSLKFQAMRNEEAAREKLNYILTRVDILAVEELEKVYTSKEISAMPNQLFYELLSDIYDANIALLISSNMLRPEVEKFLPAFIQDRFKSLKDVPLQGKSGRNDIRKR